LNLPFDPSSVKLKVGLEIHQQLDTSSKLFCSCPILKSIDLPFSFERRLSPSQSELGHIDPAAIFEYKKAKVNFYKWNPESSCLVEADEEPPHNLNEDALDTAILMALMLNAWMVDEIHVMRKIVIDGSNTSGFQRTAVVALDGELLIDEEKVGVQSITLEEDAARLIGEDRRARYFALDRLGIPLIEISLDPVVGDPDFVEEIALHLGRTLRSTGRVARGLGTIRQDLNISLLDGEVVEVKGVQKLNLVGKVVRYEAVRQMGLIKIAEEIRKRGITSINCSVKDVTKEFEITSSSVIRHALEADGKVYCVIVEKLAGLIGFEPFPGVRLGKELAEIVRANSLGGILHSDELQKQGFDKEEESRIRKAVHADENSAFILIAGEERSVTNVANLVVERLKKSIHGVPAETRAATDDGETRYMRPRPGASRMYPETDIPEIFIDYDRKQRMMKLLPIQWQQKVMDLSKRYSVSEELALQLYDSGYIDEFEAIAPRLRLNSSIVATILVEMPVRLAREGFDESTINHETIIALLHAINDGKVAKEASIDILRLIGRREASDVKEAIDKLGLLKMEEDELEKIIEEVINANSHLIAEKGDRSFSVLMGEVMKVVRGRIDGEFVSRILRAKLIEKMKDA
jgi:glutamyl-tRNA(Gln) amidotransferase subunit E